jgi:hypothetical protein
MMTPEQLHHFFMSKKSFPLSDLERPTYHHPDLGYSPHMSVSDLGSALPRGTIHIRHFVNGNNGESVHHYAYDPSMESLKHLVTKEED